MAVDTKIWLHNITLKIALKYWSEILILNNENCCKLEVTKMCFLQLFMGITRLTRKSSKECWCQVKIWSSMFNRENKMSERLSKSSAENGKNKTPKIDFAVFLKEDQNINRNLQTIKVSPLGSLPYTRGSDTESFMVMMNIILIFLIWWWGSIAQ